MCGCAEQRRVGERTYEMRCTTIECVETVDKLPQNARRPPRRHTLAHAHAHMNGESYYFGLHILSRNAAAELGSILFYALGSAFVSRITWSCVHLSAHGECSLFHFGFFVVCCVHLRSFVSFNEMRTISSRKKDENDNEAETDRTKRVLVFGYFSLSLDSIVSPLFRLRFLSLFIRTKRISFFRCFCCLKS